MPLELETGCAAISLGPEYDAVVTGAAFFETAPLAVVPAPANHPGFGAVPRRGCSAESHSCRVDDSVNFRHRSLASRAAASSANTARSFSSCSVEMPASHSNISRSWRASASAACIRRSSSSWRVEIPASHSSRSRSLLASAASPNEVGIGFPNRACANNQASVGRDGAFRSVVFLRELRCMEPPCSLEERAFAAGLIQAACAFSGV